MTVGTKSQSKGEFFSIGEGSVLSTKPTLPFLLLMALMLLLIRGQSFRAGPSVDIQVIQYVLSLLKSPTSGLSSYPKNAFPTL